MSREPLNNKKRSMHCFQFINNFKNNRISNNHALLTFPNLRNSTMSNSRMSIFKNQIPEHVEREFSQNNDLGILRFPQIIFSANAVGCFCIFENELLYPKVKNNGLDHKTSNN